jgi:hypothetical protein
MRSCVRFSFLALLVGVIVAVAAPGAQAAVGIEKFVATNCKAAFPECAEEAGPTTAFGPTKIPKEPSKEEAEVQGFTQAGGHVPFGVTDFKLTTVVTGAPLPSTEAPTGIVKHIRTDVAPGLATSPAAVPQCSGTQFGETEAVPGSGFFPAPTCPAVGPTSTVVGSQEATVYAGAEAGDVPLSGTVYNLVQKEGLASEFGVALSIPQPLSAGALKAGFKKAEEEGAVPGVGGFPTLGQQTTLEAGEYFAHTLIEGSVEWGQETKGTNQGDYHDYFEINVSTALPLIRSRLSFFGTNGNGAFITNATSCPGHNTTRLATTGTDETTVTRNFTTPIGLSGCGAVPFEPSLALTPGTSAFDQPDEITTQVGIPRHTGAAEVDAAQLKTASVTLPEGMTLNPSAAAGLAACSPAQARIHSAEKGVGCPAASKIGTVELIVPTLPEKEPNGEVPLKGNIYLGGPETGPITGPPYNIYLDAESTRYGVSVRIKGQTIPNEATGRVTTVFDENPEQPFTKVSMHFDRANLTAIANPLSCGAATTSGSFVPFTTPEGATKSAFTAFTPTGCPNPIPFALTQSATNQTTTAGGHTNYTFNLGRADGQQYLSQVKTTLPEGLVGAIPTVTQCTEAQATSNTCPATSQIGTAAAISGSGPTPFTFDKGIVYLTGPYQGAPYGLSIVIPAVAGPFNLGPVTTRAKIDVDPTTARVTTTANVPTIVKGIPTRLRGISVSVNKQGFLFNPTNCRAEATDSTLTGFTPGVAGSVTQNISSPFQLTSCNLLKFKPAFKASTNGKTSKANGASLTTTVTPVAGQANIRSVKVQLPKALPSRLTTLQKACTEKTFAADPFKCPSGSFVGGATVITPTLPGKMTGPAILVSHGGAAFPDLDLVVQSNGVRVILVGNTDIKKGITTTTFASTPDVPVTGVTVNLPIGSHSALAANGNLCTTKLVMPTTITGQNGTVVKQNTAVSVANCGVRIAGHKVVGNTAFLTVQTFGAGRISGKGNGLATKFRKLAKAQKRATLKVPLSRRGSRRHRPFKVRVRVGFVPKTKGAKSSSSFVTVSFR